MKTEIFQQEAAIVLKITCETAIEMYCTQLICIISPLIKTSMEQMLDEIGLDYLNYTTVDSNPIFDLTVNSVTLYYVFMKKNGVPIHIDECPEIKRHLDKFFDSENLLRQVKYKKS